MRVVCPYTDLHPKTKSALTQYAPQAEYFNVSGSDDAYYFLLSGIWAAQEAFLLIEHDIEIHERVVAELENCSEPWCLYAYGSGTQFLIDSSLGCTRFSAELMINHPDMFKNLGETNWWGLDAQIQRTLEGYGYSPHIHSPIVTHHHAY